MRTSAWAPLAVLALLVGGAVVTRGSTAVHEAGVRAASGPEPSGATSEAPDEGPRLSADGLPGLRLGDPGWGALAWVVDGVVPSVLVSAVGSADGATGRGPEAPDSGLTTWLGPTLGSPVAAVGGLAGASTRAHRPFGDDGPVVTVVQLVRDGVDTVWSDVGSPGRVSTVEVRPHRGRAGRGRAHAGAAARSPVGPEVEPPVEGGPLVLQRIGVRGVGAGVSC